MSNSSNYKMQSRIIGGAVGMATALSDTITIGGNYNDSLMPGAAPYINVALIRASGGTIVQCRAGANSVWEYHIIPEGVVNFDTELGKIISMTLLKA